MKNRTGFVSNSSSTSFCIFGITVVNNKENENIFERVYELPPGKILTAACGIDNYCGEIVIGLDVKYMKDDETLFKFKERVVSELKKIDIDATVLDIKCCIDGGNDNF